MLGLAARICATAVIATTTVAAPIIVTTAPASGQHDTGQYASHSHTQHVFFHFYHPNKCKKYAPILGAQSIRAHPSVLI
ncbi:hypothetical protein D3C85_1095160 [compost metagenome]